MGAVRSFVEIATLLLASPRGNAPAPPPIINCSQRRSVSMLAHYVVAVSAVYRIGNPPPALKKQHASPGANTSSMGQPRGSHSSAEHVLCARSSHLSSLSIHTIRWPCICTLPAWHCRLADTVSPALARCWKQLSSAPNNPSLYSSNNPLFAKYKNPSSCSLAFCCPAPPRTKPSVLTDLSA